MEIYVSSDFVSSYFDRAMPFRIANSSEWTDRFSNPPGGHLDAARHNFKTDFKPQQ